MTGRQRSHDRAERFMAFRQCTHCSYDILTGEGERSCDYGMCANLPEELDVTCPTCNHNFVTNETRLGCEKEPCDFARYEAPQRVANLQRWAAQHAPTKTVGA